MNPFPTFPDWSSRDYMTVFQWRQRQIALMRAKPLLALGAKEFYRTRSVEFIEHWCVTYDPRNAGTDKLSTMPFVLFQRQKDMTLCLQQAIALETSVLVEKCRDMGATWLCGAFSVWLWNFVEGAAIGWGSRKEQLVDKLGDPDSIFEKMRIIIRYLPRELLPIGFSNQDHMPFMRIINPESGASITGEAGDNIGRGGRKLIYFKDESAHYAQPEKIEAALSETTRVQVDISSVNGLGNVFHRRRESGVEWNPLVPMMKNKTAVFVMDWRDHPEKTQEWYEAKRQKAIDDGLEHIFAQEIDRNYAASVTGTIIKSEWIEAAVDAHIALKFDDEGGTYAGLDVADGLPNGDANACTVRKGPIVKDLDTWGGLDTGETTRRTIVMLTPYGPLEVDYDSIGVGAGVKAEVNRLVVANLLPRSMRFIPWPASASPLYPDKRLIPGDKDTMLNKDFFGNIKAQGWWQVARRFERTFRARTQGVVYDPGTMISLPSKLRHLGQLKKELAQAVIKPNVVTMKMIVDKAPDGTRSPNCADSLIQAFWPIPPAGPRYTTEALK